MILHRFIKFGQLTWSHPSRVHAKHKKGSQARCTNLMYDKCDVTYVIQTQVHVVGARSCLSIGTFQYLIIFPSQSHVSVILISVFK